MLSKKRFNISGKIILGYVFVILCLSLAVFGVSGRITELQKEIDFIANHDIEVQRLANQIEKHVLNLQNGQKGYILNGNTSYLDFYASENSLWLADYNKLHELLSDSPIQQKNLEAIKTNITDWIQKAAEPVILLKKENKEQELQNFVKMDPGKGYIDQIRAQFDALRSMETQMSAARTSALDDKNKQIKTDLLIYFLLISAIAIIIGFLVSGSISKTIKQTIRAIKEISNSNGEKVSRIEIKSNDEVHDLAVSVNELLDIHEQYLWYQSSVSELAVISNGINDVNQLAQLFINKLAAMLGASYGVFYLRMGKGKQQKLVKVAAYAAYGTEKGMASFDLGEGLVGQSALENRIFYLDSVPDDYMKITSGLGQTSPKFILVAPISFEGRVEAVIELSSLNNYTTMQRGLIDSATGNFGVVLDSVRRSMEVERLLKESQTQSEELQSLTEELQAQTEELQVQQEELRANNEQLEEQNESALHKASELEKAKKDLEILAVELQRNSAYKSEFLANMSHELRTPLNSVIILSQMLHENKNGTLNPEEAEYARVISAAGNDLLTIIDDILDLSKVDAGKIEILVDEVQINELPQLMHSNFGPLAEKKGIQFDVVMDKDIPNRIYTDGRRLQQILRNLLSNAFKFTDKGSVTLKIQKADSNVAAKHFQSHIESTILAISIEDTGVGIPRDKQGLIFNAFQQAEGTTNRRFGGTGLGLSICREFTRLLGGVILLESEENKGSTFTLCVPSMSKSQEQQTVTAQIEVAAAFTNTVQSNSIQLQSSTRSAQLADRTKESIEFTQKETNPEPTLFKNKRVLLVDDDIRNVFALTISLENEGMIVKVATNGREGLEILLEEERFDLVLMDIMMPVMDGYEAMQAIRSNPAHAELPIIALTAKAMKNDREKCLEFGASDYISKPLQIDQLFSLMRVWLTR
jgi:two-component system chemotaxis sensor kinase CheA